MSKSSCFDVIFFVLNGLNMRIIQTVIFLVSIAYFANANNGDSQRNASLTIQQVQASPGNNVNVAVIANNFGDINTFESRIAFNPEILTFVSVTEVHHAIGNAASNLVGDSLFAINWFGFPAKSIANGATLFKLQFQFCDDLLSCYENDPESPVEVVANSAFIGLLNPDFTFTQTILDYSNGSVFADNPLRMLTVDVIGEGNVYVNDQPYTQAIIAEETASIQLLAVPGMGYEFSEWSGDIISNANPFSLHLIDDLHVIANFIVDTSNDTFLHGIIIENNEVVCFDAITRMFVAGNFLDELFLVKNGGAVTLIAGESIVFLPGTSIEHGGYMLASIHADHPFCPDNKYIQHPYDDTDNSSWESGDIPKGENTAFLIYPNPASSKITIDVSGYEANEYLHLEILSILGKPILSRKITAGNSHVVELAGFTKGIYVLRIAAGKQMYHHRIIIK